jgi:hypothetical protein
MCNVFFFSFFFSGQAAALCDADCEHQQVLQEKAEPALPVLPSCFETRGAGMSGWVRPLPLPTFILTVLRNWSQRAVPHALPGFLGGSFDLPDHNVSTSSLCLRQHCALPKRDIRNAPVQHGPELEGQLALQVTANAGEVG